MARLMHVTRETVEKTASASLFRFVMKMREKKMEGMMPMLPHKKKSRGNIRGNH
jgi:hypothetical protein